MRQQQPRDLLSHFIIASDDRAAQYNARKHALKEAEHAAVDLLLEDAVPALENMERAVFKIRGGYTYVEDLDEKVQVLLSPLSWQRLTRTLGCQEGAATPQREETYS